MTVPLSGALRFLLPDPAGAALLRVCLCPEHARTAWAEWTRLGGDLGAFRPLLPLVDAGLRASRVAPLPEVAARLAAARLHESLRWPAVREAAADALGLLARAELDPVVVGDVALAATAYEDPALRHCGALEVLLGPGAVAVGGRCLAAAGYRPAPDAAPTGVALARPGGLPIRLESALFPLDPRRGDGAGLRARAAPLDPSLPARVPAPADLLALVLARAALGAERRTLLWACDAAALLRSAPDLDGDAVAEDVHRWELGLPVGWMAGWLATEIGVPVPPAIPARMASRPTSGRAARREVETALACARADGRAGVRDLVVSARGWRERASVVRWTAIPSRDRLRRSHPEVPVAALPVLYVARPALAALRAVRRRRAPAPERASPAIGGARAAARNADPAGPAGDRPSASRRSSG